MRRTHGLSTTRIYKSWANMRDRCEKPTHPAYPRYGGRGIRVCDRWFLFENFLEDMGLMPVGMSLDRKDTDGDYTPENCRWATPKQQSNNQSGQKRYVINGLEGTTAELCDALGLNYQTVYLRIKNGWKVEDAFRSGNFSGQKAGRKTSSSWK